MGRSLKEFQRIGSCLKACTLQIFVFSGHQQSSIIWYLLHDLDLFALNSVSYSEKSWPNTTVSFFAGCCIGEAETIEII